MFIVYSTDNLHSYASRDVIALSKSIPQAIKLIRAHAKKSGDKISEDDLFNLQNIKQTQGFEGEGEYFIEEVAIGVLL